MWFLIKGSFWFAAVLVVLSYFSSHPAAEDRSANALQVTDALSAATEAYHYVSAMCSEKPQVCEKGSETFSVLGVRAKEGARVAFELLDKQFGGKGTGVEAQAGTRQEAETALVADPNPSPMPVKLNEAVTTPDRIFTGTVPVPQKRPAR
jgi:hypothetical protein